MSLQLAAQHLSNQGRGPDDTLVHMSRNEVKSLNDLAMAHGGQLTINPQTGLPEAGFLSMILPMVAGAALGPAGMGLTAMQAGLAVGAGSYLLNPKGGLMGALSSGLGGYGGAGLGAGLEKLGTSEAGQTVQNLEKSAVDTQMQQLEANRADMLAKQKLAMESGYGNMDPGMLQPYSAADTAANRAALLNEYQTTRGYVAEPGGGYTALGAPEVKIPTGFDAIKQGIGAVMDDPSKLKQVGGGSWTGLAQMGLAAAAPAISQQAKFTPPTSATSGKQVVPHYRFTPGMATPTPAASPTGVENTYFPGSRYTALSNEEAQQLYPGYPDYTKPAANGGIMGYAAGGPVEQMSNNAAIGANTMYPMANMATSAFATPYQTPHSTNMMAAMNPSGGGTVDAMSGEPNMQGTRMAGGGASVEDPYRTTPDDTLETAYAKAQEKNDIATMRAIEKEADIRNTNKAGMTKGLSGMKGLATGGISDARYNLGGYSDGGRLLRGPGDGVSDSIPATIGHKQPARLADGEFVVPARIVSELGNGSTEAGARKLYAMLDRVQAARKHTVGKGKVAKNNRADRYLPA